MTEAGSTSAGVGIAVRTHLGHSAADGVHVPQCAQSRLKVTWMGAFCKGGMHLLTLYLWHSEGPSCRNLDLLQAAAGVIRQLRGPWVIAADWNMCPNTLRGTGFLELVHGCIQASGQATCNDQEYDFFVIDRRLTAAVVSVKRVGNAGTSPHSPVRLLMKGRPRRHTVRVLVVPKKAMPDLPAGCLEERHTKGWDSIIPDGSDPQCLDDAYLKWIQMLEEQVADVENMPGRERKKFCTRSLGPKFVVKPALGKPGSKDPK
eukprot:8511242-Karenia_brevis.AAC.1